MEWGGMVGSYGMCKCISRIEYAGISLGWIGCKRIRTKTTKEQLTISDKFTLSFWATKWCDKIFQDKYLLIFLTFQFASVWQMY